MVRERQRARELQHRVLVLADDLGAQFRMAAHALQVGRGEFPGFAQHFGRHADLADVVQRRSLVHQLGDLGFHARSQRDELRVLADAHHTVAGGGAFVELHGPPQAAHELRARVLELRGALLHLALELHLAVGEGEMRTHARHQQLAVDRLGEVIHRTQVQPLHLVGGLGLAGEEDDRDARGGGVFLEQLADLEAAGARHVHVEQDQVGPGVGGREAQGIAAVGGELDLVLGTEHLADQGEQILRVIYRENHRPGGVLAHPASLPARVRGRLTRKPVVYNPPPLSPSSSPAGPRKIPRFLLDVPAVGASPLLN